MLEAEISGRIDPVTGMVINIKVLDKVLREKVIEAFDGKSMNDEISFFFDHAPSLYNARRQQ